MVEERLSEDEVLLINILLNPITFSEFINNIDLLPIEEKFELSWYQKQILADFSSLASVCAARATGKTVSLVQKITWLLAMNIFPDDYICYIVPAENQLDPVWTGLVRNFRTNSFLQHFISKTQGINGSSHTITLLSRAELKCRIAGQTGTGISVIGLHTPYFILDESGYFNWGTWLELQPTLNRFTSGWQLLVAGVPDGRREKSVCYYCDTSDFYSHHRFSSLDNPRFSDMDYAQAIIDYGGEDSEDFAHFVRGEHGKQAFSIFDRSMMLIEDYPAYTLEINGTTTKDINEIYSRLTFLPEVDKKTILGVDLGYTEPTAIIVFTLDSLERFRPAVRIELKKVEFPIQERILDYIDTKYNPILIGFDRGAGGQGISFEQHLKEDRDFAHKGYNKRLIPVDFQSYITIGMDMDGKEIKQKAKPLAVNVAQEYANKHKIIFSNKDLTFVTELERMTYTKTLSGDIVYRTLTERGGKSGADHFTSALLCAMLAWHRENEYIDYTHKKRKLFGARWLR